MVYKFLCFAKIAKIPHFSLNLGLKSTFKLMADFEHTLNGFKIIADEFKETGCNGREIVIRAIFYCRYYMLFPSLFYIDKNVRKELDIYDKTGDRIGSMRIAEIKELMG